MALKIRTLQSWRKSAGWWLVAAGATSAAVSCGSEDAPAPSDDSVIPVGGAMGEGGQEGMTPNASVLRLTSQFPEDGSDMNTAEPLRFEFNLPLDEKTVEAALRVRVAGRDLAVEWQVAANELFVWLDTVPALPATLSLALGRDLKGKNGEEFAGDSLTLSVPLWLPLAKSDGASASASFAQTAKFSLAAREENGELVIVEKRGAASSVLEVPGGRSFDGVSVVGAEASDAGISLIWVEQAGEGKGAYVAFWDGEAWRGGDSPVFEAEALHVASSRAGDDLTLAVLSSGQVHVFSGQLSGEIEPLHSALQLDDARANELAVALNQDGRTVVASVTALGRLELHQADGANWSALGEVKRARVSGPARPSLVLHEERLWLAYEDGDQVSSHAYVAELTGSSVHAHPALDLELDSQAHHIQLTSGDQGLYVAWVEQSGIENRAFVARLHEGRPTILGHEALGDLADDIVASQLAVDTFGQPSFVLATDSGVFGSRFNGSPSLPSALDSRGERGACAIPADGSEFPATLSETGCYTNLGQRRLVSAAIPYNINSPLWSDGTAKRRYIMLPPEGTVGFTGTGGWLMPVGSIIIKEFYLEREVGDASTLFPVETRFLVKRCEEDACSAPWQGYSYRWNAGGTDGTLLDHVDDQVEHGWTVTENGTPRTHQHIYPGRQTCFSCHSVSAGRVLGIDSPQLSRPQDYGDYIADQLTTWAGLDLFGDSASSAQLAAVERLPSPADVSHSLSSRTLAYFDSNCAHCHHPTTMQPGAQALDMRFDGAGLVKGGNICSRITPGEPDVSLIHQRQQNRGATTPTQMPPIATHLTDQRQLQLSSAWIFNLLETGECTP